MTHLRRSLGGVALMALASHVAAQTPAAQTGSVSSTFIVSYRGAQIGREDITVTETPDAWTISSTGRENVPLDLVVHRFEIVYTKDWQARTLAIDATAQGQPLTRSSTFSPTAATTTSTDKGVTSTVTQPVSARTVVLPNNFFAAYEALAARLGTMAIGAALPVYVLPQGELTATVDRVTPKHILKPDGSLDIRQYDLTITDPRGPIGVELWVDEHNRLARVSIPARSILVQRDDLTSVMLRVENLFHPGDEAVSIPALGFSLAGTLSKPAGASSTEPAPAVILVGSAGLTDRDEMAFGVPIFAQMAMALADAGFIVVRYDKRALGQSGGRAESAGLEEYTDDVAAALTWLRARKDVDAKRIALVAYGEGGAVGLLEAARTSQIAALALIGVTGLTGKDVTLRQQEDLLARMTDPADVKDQKRDVQARLVDAVMTGKGWDAIPPGLRSSSDTPWFKSWLLFDPAVTMKKVSQPVFIGIGALDRQAFADSVDRLAAASVARKKPPTHTTKLVVAGINHLLVPATTGDVSEYDKLPTRTISPELLSALTNWLKDTLPGKKKQG